jgi:hypothetical protein
VLRQPLREHRQTHTLVNEQDFQPLQLIRDPPRLLAVSAVA